MLGISEGLLEGGNEGLRLGEILGLLLG